MHASAPAYLVVLVVGRRTTATGVTAQRSGARTATPRLPPPAGKVAKPLRITPSRQPHASARTRSTQSKNPQVTPASDISTAEGNKPSMRRSSARDGHRPAPRPSSTRLPWVPLPVSAAGLPTGRCRNRAASGRSTVPPGRWALSPTSLPWPRSSAIKACSRPRWLQGAAFGGSSTQQPTTPAVPSRLTSRQQCPTCTTAARAVLLASTPGGCTPRHPPPFLVGVIPAAGRLAGSGGPRTAHTQAQVLVAVAADQQLGGGLAAVDAVAEVGLDQGAADQPVLDGLAVAVQAAAGLKDHAAGR
jgi:hypothetical protein